MSDRFEQDIVFASQVAEVIQQRANIGWRFLSMCYIEWREGYGDVLIVFTSPPLP